MAGDPFNLKLGFFTCLWCTWSEARRSCCLFFLLQFGGRSVICAVIFSCNKLQLDVTWGESRAVAREIKLLALPRGPFD